MAKFCFVSFAQAGHSDFGGMSYVRTAVELKNRGHQINWILSRYPLLKRYKQEEHFVRAKNSLKEYGIGAKEFSGLHRHVFQKSEDIQVYAKNFAQYLDLEQYDCVVVDRLCVVAAFSAHLAGLPWVSMGTDGREWTQNRLRIINDPGIFPGTWEASPINKIACHFYRDNFPKPSTKSYWATSPFLNISFFPRVYYQDNMNLEHPKHSHFVGCGGEPEPITDQRYLLVTFGNSFDSLVRHKLMKILKPLIRQLSINVLFLAGHMDVASDLRHSFRHNSGVEIREWMQYDKAYRGAIGVLGHGGTSHIWYGLREGKPLFAIPFMADQYYGALQLERLNVGRTVVPLVVPLHLSHVLRRIGNQIPKKVKVILGRRELSNKLNELLSNSKIRDCSIGLRRLMRTGGGIQASVSLIEHLADIRKPVSTCAAPSCCC